MPLKINLQRIIFITILVLFGLKLSSSSLAGVNIWTGIEQQDVAVCTIAPQQAFQDDSVHMEKRSGDFVNQPYEYNLYLPTIYCEINSSPATIIGRVIDSLGVPVDGINLAMMNGDFRVDSYSDKNGDFTAEVIQGCNPIWNVQIVGISCSSRVMDPSTCLLKGYFERNYSENIAVPQSQPLIFTYEKATTVMNGTVIDLQGVPISDVRVFAFRSDNARSWGASLENGKFALPASDGSWDAYAVKFNPWTEGTHVNVNIVNGVATPDPLILNIP